VATVIHLYSRKVVDLCMEVSLVSDAVKPCNTAYKSSPPHSLWHADRGSQYHSCSHKDLFLNMELPKV